MNAPRRVLEHHEARCRPSSKPASWWAVQGECPLAANCARAQASIPPKSATVADFRHHVTKSYGKTTCARFLSLHTDAAPSQRKVRPPLGSGDAS